MEVGISVLPCMTVPPGALAADLLTCLPDCSLSTLDTLPTPCITVSEACEEFIVLDGVNKSRGETGTPTTFFNFSHKIISNILVVNEFKDNSKAFSFCFQSGSFGERNTLRGIPENLQGNLCSGVGETLEKLHL